MQQKFFSVPFASSGDITPVPNAVDANGKVSYAQGWGPNYALDTTTNPNAFDIDRASTNSLLNDITKAMGALQSVGVPEWISATDNNGTAFAYAAYSHVRYQNPSTSVWTEYVSTVDGNTDTPGASSKWQPALSLAASNADAVAGTSTALTITPAALAYVIAQVILPKLEPVGAMKMFAMNSVPANYLFMDGRAISRTTYALLFAAIGTTWGAGDGSTTFNLPDGRGVDIRGFDNGAGRDPGRTFGTYEADQYPLHSHAITDAGHTHSITQTAHTHAITQSPHAHGVSDPGHSHGVSDPGHTHSGTSINYGVQPIHNGDQSPVLSAPFAQNVSSSGTGISINGAGTGIGVQAQNANVTNVAANANITNNNATTGILLGNAGTGTEVRVKNITGLACIRYQ